MGGGANSCMAPLFLAEGGQTGQGERWVVWPTPTWGPLFLSVPSGTKSNEARREMGGVTNSYSRGHVPYMGGALFQYVLFCHFLLEERQTGPGER